MATFDTRIQKRAFIAPNGTDFISVKRITSGGQTIWRRVTLITFDANGGQGGWSDHKQPGTPLVAPTVTRTGYTFLRWEPAVPSTVPEGDATYVAQWQIDTYTVTFNANGGTGSMSPQTFTYGVSQTISPNGFSRSGYDFIGWAETPTGDVAYSDRQSVIISSDKTLYAVWQEQNYILSETGIPIADETGINIINLE